MLDKIAHLAVMAFFMGIFIYEFYFKKREHPISFMDFFKNEKGDLSSTRLSMFICVWLFVYIVKRSLGLLPAEVNFELIALVAAAAFSPKLIQNITEKKDKK